MTEGGNVGPPPLAVETESYCKRLLGVPNAEDDLASGTAEGCFVSTAARGRGFVIGLNIVLPFSVKARLPA